MEVTLYIPYANGDCVNGFRYDKPLSTKEYVKMETTEYESHKRGVDTMISTQLGQNIAYNNYEKRRIDVTKQSYAYHTCKCRILNVEGKDETLNEMIGLSRTKEKFVSILSLSPTDIRKDADLQIDLRQWLSESCRIQDCTHITDAEKLKHLPIKDFKITIKDDNSNAILKGCKCIDLDSSDISRFAVLVERVFFIK
jgi:hypothetical protein